MKLNEGGQRKPDPLPSLREEEPSNGRPRPKKANTNNPPGLPLVPRGLPWSTQLSELVAFLKPYQSQPFSGRKEVFDRVWRLCLQWEGTKEQIRELFVNDVSLLKQAVSKSPTLRGNEELRARIERLEQIKEKI